MTAINPYALDAAARRVGDRWSLRIVAALLDGERTFGELAAAVDGIAPTVLTARLRALQRMALVTAMPYATRPVRMRYALTDPGRRLAGSLGALEQWGAAREGDASATTHVECGTAVETRPWCPTCDRPVDGETAPAPDGADERLVWC